ncbi:MAG: YhbY family RNA-binding protein [Eubacteriaceae bacterium]|nr:YhbY family RNA-binding protein [Eubacteriaceae bacterium]
MLNSKQRSFLKKKSAELKDTIFIGKEGITANVIRQLAGELAAHELIKGKVQNNAEISVQQAAHLLAEQTDAEVVFTIGKKFVLYKMNGEKQKMILPEG